MERVKEGTAVLELDVGFHEEELEGKPLTFLVSQPSSMFVLDEHPLEFVSEIDTLAQGSGDSDTI